MSWWYTPQDKDKFHKWDEYEDVVFAIAAKCRFKMDKHIVPNYYIYNDNGLVDIIKGSEIDPLSILRFDDTENDRAFLSDYREVCEDGDEEFQRLLAIVGRKYYRNAEQLNKIKETVTYCLETYDSIEDIDMWDKYSVKEYSMKYMHGNNLEAYIQRIINIDKNRMKSLEARDMRNIPIILEEAYDMSKLPEECCAVVAYNGDKLIGFTIISKGTSNSCDMDAKVIFRFLLLVGASDFVIVHNHPQGEPRMSQADYEITKSLLQASDFMNINMIEHIIIGIDDYDEILLKVKEMNGYNCSDVFEYYNNYYEE